MPDNALIPIDSEPIRIARSRPDDRQPAAVYLARLATGSRRTMAQALTAIARLVSDGRLDALSMPWEGLRYAHTAAIRARLAESYRHTTANKMLAALRGVLQECWRLGLMSADDYQRSVDIASIKGTTVPKGRKLSRGELAALMDACASDSSSAGRRDAALIAVMYAAGLRRAEVVTLNVADFTPATGELLIRGKGNKERMVYATNGAALALEDWLAARGVEEGPLFCSTRRRLARMTEQAVLVILMKRAKQAGVTAHFSPHDMRRSFITELLEAGADVGTVQKLAGHANVATTLRYDRRDEKAKRAAAEMLHIPYSGKV